ncbi:MAG: hypothetical protein JXA28_02935 [Bacteroidetes bacterium]|nr:hypothetical protein [Bacteroidota bacterium]
MDHYSYIIHWYRMRSNGASVSDVHPSNGVTHVVSSSKPDVRGEGSDVLVRTALRETDFDRFTYDTMFCGLRKGVLTSGEEYTSRVIPRFPDRNIVDPADAESENRIYGLDIVIETASGQYTKRYLIRDLKSLAVRALRMTGRENVLASGLFRYSIMAVGVRDEAVDPNGEATIQSGIQIWKSAEHVFQLEHGTSPVILEPDATEYPVFIRKSVLEGMREHVRSFPDREVAGFLTGHLYRDGHANDVYAVIDDHHPARHTTDATATQVTINSDSWSAFLSEMERKPGNTRTVAWYHSHPFVPAHGDGNTGHPGATRNPTTAWSQNTSVFLSADDLWIHENFFTHPYMLAIVLDPHCDPGPDIGVWGWRDGNIRSRTIILLDEEEDNG